MKNGRLDRFAEHTERFAAGVIIILMLAFMLFLTVSAFTGTSDLNLNDVSGENIDFITDNVFLNIIISMLLLLALYLFYKHCGAVRLKKMKIILFGWYFLFGTAFILSAKLRSPSYSDSFIVTYAAQRAAVGDLSQLSEDYFFRFPFQLGYVLYSEFFFRVLGFVFRGFPEGYFCLALQEVNLLWVLFACYSLIRVSEYFSRDTRTQKIIVLLFFCCIPALLSCTFLYGNIPAFGCGAGALWMFLDFLKGGKLSRAVLCALFLTFAVTLKLNLLIFAVAIGAIWVIEILKKRSFRSLVCLLLTAACVLSVSKMPQSFYEKRTGLDYGDGIPMLGWMAMGFSEGHAAPGWYKEDNTVTAFRESGNDPEAVSENARKVLRERTDFFITHPGDAFSFFSAKLRSQWNEPSCQSLWINQVFPSYSEKGRVYDMLCGKGEGRSLQLMNQYQQLVFAGTLLGLAALRKKKDIGCLLLPLVILGGLSYHLLFEAKSQYALPYFVMMVPLAGYGFARFFRRVEER